MPNAESLLYEGVCGYKELFARYWDGTIDRALWDTLHKSGKLISKGKLI